MIFIGHIWFFLIAHSAFGSGRKYREADEHRLSAISEGRIYQIPYFSEQQNPEQINAWTVRANSDLLKVSDSFQNLGKGKGDTRKL